MTSKAKSWKNQALKSIRAGYLEGPRIIEDDLEVTVHWYLKYNRDIDGGIKLLLDTFEGIWFKNDNQIKILHIFKTKDKDNPRVEIEVLPIEKQP